MLTKKIKTKFLQKKTQIFFNNVTTLKKLQKYHKIERN